MRALVAEYTVFHDPNLAPEGAAMLSTIRSSFERCGYDVVSPETGDFASELSRLAPDCDVGLVIAPDNLLGKFTKTVEDHTRNIGCGSLNVALCANKRRAGAILSAHGLSVPKEQSEGMRLIKKISGVDGLNMRRADEVPAADEFGQEYIEGENLSVSLIGSRVVGDTCLSFSGAGPLVLAINSQDIREEEGRFRYCGGTTPVDHPRHDELISAATQAVHVLGCQGYVGVDIVLADKPYIVDVNPRPTTSLVGIAQIMEEEIAQLLVDASHGVLPDEVHLKGAVSFLPDGSVKRA